MIALPTAVQMSIGYLAALKNITDIFIFTLARRQLKPKNKEPGSTVFFEFSTHLVASRALIMTLEY